jgi:hypothetical protein
MTHHQPTDMTRSQSYPPPAPVPVEVVEDRLTPWARAVSFLKDLIVIVTCSVILYTIYNAYVAIGELQDRLQNISDTFGGVGG